MRAARFALLALLSVAVVTSGCAGLLGPDRPPSDERAIEAVERGLAADVDAYRFTLEGHVEAQGDGERISFDVTGSGRVNVTTERMNATVDAREETRGTFISGDTAYKDCSRPWGWARTNLSEEHRWYDYTPAGSQLALLNRTDVYWRGTETVDGREAAVVEAYPTEDELRSTPRVGDPTDTGDANLQNATIRVLLDRETGRVLKSHREIQVEGNGATATAEVTYRFDGYDEPTAVQRPDFDEENVLKLGCPGE